MERKILFKAKRLSDDKWVEGDLYHNVRGFECCIGQQERNDVYVYPVDPTTICQHTGLKDREGNDILEGDLLTTKDGTVIFVVGFVGCEYAASRKDEHEFIYNLYALSKNCTVCGSKFDRKGGEK